MENLPYLYRYLTITVNKKQMQDLQTVFTALRHSSLFGKGGWEIFFSVCENLEISSSYSQRDRSFPYSKWDKSIFFFFEGQGDEWDENCFC